MQEMLSTLGVSEARIETGSMRVDINLSVHSATSPVSTPRIEIKNLDSFAVFCILYDCLIKSIINSQQEQLGLYSILYFD